MSVSCALMATSLQQWARRYIYLTQPARCSPEKRARRRAFFANGVDEMHIPWAVEGLPTLLHLSLFLFFGGLVIFLFNVDHDVFTCVVCGIVLFSIAYAFITLLPFIRQDSPYYTPLSRPAWFLYAGIQYVFLAVFIIITLPIRVSINQEWRFYYRYGAWILRMLRGMEKEVEKAASEQSSEIDFRIFGWTISALGGDDDSLEKFFEASPGWFNSRLMEHLKSDFPEEHLERFWHALDRFMGQTDSSNSVTQSVKSRRVNICRDIISVIPYSRYYSCDNLSPHFDQAPVSIESLQAMSPWFTHKLDSFSLEARVGVSKNLPRIQERDDRWIALASDVYGIEKPYLEHAVALGGDNVFLAILIHLSRSNNYNGCVLVGGFPQFDICNTLPGLQHDFCTRWNEMVREGAKKGHISSLDVLLWIRRHYIALHQGTDAAPTVFSASTRDYDSILRRPSSYPLCDIASHRPESTAPILTQPLDSPDPLPHHSTSRGSGDSQQAKEVTIIPGPSSPFDPTTPSEVGDGSQSPAATSPVLPVDVLPPGSVATALQDTPPAPKRLSSPSTPASPSILAPESDTLTLNKSFDAGPAAGTALTSNPSLPVSSVVGFSVPSPLPSPVPPFSEAEFLALLSSTALSRPIGNATLPRLCARGLVNTGSMCFANTVLQILVHSPPFWNLFTKLGNLKGQRGAETGGIATPLVDATVRFFEEFTFKEKGPPPLPEITRGKPREDEKEKKEAKVVDSFEATYMYDAMRGKRQLKRLLVRSRGEEAPFCY